MQMNIGGHLWESQLSSGRCDSGEGQPVQLSFGRFLRVDFQGSRVTSSNMTGRLVHVFSRRQSSKRIFRLTGGN